MKKLVIKLLPIIDFFMAPLVYPCAWILENVRRAGVNRLPRCKDALLSVGVFPVLSHYYEPQFDYRDSAPLSKDRRLLGISWNVEEQLDLLAKFTCSQELEDLSNNAGDVLDFHFGNNAFESGDAEYWYQLIRHFKPSRIIEVGSGHSTLMAIKATRKNGDDTPDYRCKHLCIEPFEAAWLEKAGVSVIRKKIEDVELSFFAELEENDILFIDSSHMIRPQGDVLFEYLELLPALKKGVIVHVHDIFSPRNYPREWIQGQVKFWNELYLLEAFLSHNSHWKIIGALNYLHHHYYDRLKLVAPFLAPDREPGSFCIQKIA